MSVRAFSPVSQAAPRNLEHLGISILRYALALILIYFGAFKFTPTEARAIQR